MTALAPLNNFLLTKGVYDLQAAKVVTPGTTTLTDFVFSGLTSGVEGTMSSSTIGFAMNLQTNRVNPIFGPAAPSSLPPLGQTHQPASVPVETVAGEVKHIEDLTFVNDFSDLDAVVAQIPMQNKCPAD